MLASEYPERFEAIWDNAPEYVDRASQIFATLSRLSEKFAEEVERRSVDSYEQVHEDSATRGAFSRDPHLLTAADMGAPSGSPICIAIMSSEGGDACR